MSRVTITNLRRTVESLNSLVLKPGFYDIDSSYGGYRIVSHGGSRDVSPRGSAREIQDWLFAFKAGFCFAVDENQSGPIPRYRAAGLDVILNEASTAARYYAQEKDNPDSADIDTERAYVAARDAVRVARILNGQ